MMCLHLRAAVATPVAVRTRCYSSWGKNNKLSYWNNENTWDKGNALHLKQPFYVKAGMLLTSCIKITLVHLTWQFRRRDVLSVLVGELLECSQAAAEAQDGICRDTAIWQAQKDTRLSLFNRMVTLYVLWVWISINVRDESSTSRCEDSPVR